MTKQLVTIGLLHKMSIPVIQNNGELEPRSYINRIPLIKLFRDCSGKGLKDSKEIIDSTIDNWSVSSPISSPMSVDMDKLVAVFQPYLTQTIDVDAAQTALLDAISCACNKWQTLGFNNKFEAIDKVVDNFRCKES